LANAAIAASRDLGIAMRPGRRFLLWVSRLPNDQQQQFDLTNAAIAASRVGS
jgi:hypothetical protein